MGEIIYVTEYLERRAAEVAPEGVQQRLAEIAIEVAVLNSEKDMLISRLKPQKE